MAGRGEEQGLAGNVSVERCRPSGIIFKTKVWFRNLNALGGPGHANTVPPALKTMSRMLRKQHTTA